MRSYVEAKYICYYFYLNIGAIYVISHDVKYIFDHSPQVAINLVVNQAPGLHDFF